MIKMKDLVLEGRQIQESFNKKMINEFSPMGEIHTALEVYLDGVERPFVGDYISEGNRSMVVKRILQIMTKIAEKYDGEITGKYSPAIIEWGRSLEQSEFDEIYNELQSAVENVFNTNLFEFATGGYLYKATGVLGTPISKGKITKWLTKHGGTGIATQYREGTLTEFGEGDKYQREYREFLENLSSERSRFDNEKIKYKIGQIMSTYFAQNPQAIVKKTDWLQDVKPKILKLYK